MQPAVLELVDRAQVQRRQVDELAHARLVEEAVAGDDALDVPERPAEHDADAKPHARTLVRSRERGRVPDAATSAPTKISASTTTARWIERCSVKTAAHATKTLAIVQASTAETLRCPSARATAQPGARTHSVPNASRR